MKPIFEEHLGPYHSLLPALRNFSEMTVSINLRGYRRAHLKKLILTGSVRKIWI